MFKFYINSCNACAQKLNFVLYLYSRIPKTEARVTAVACTTKSHAIWVGTHGGYIGLVDFTKLEPITLTRRYVRSVRCLVHVKDCGT